MGAILAVILIARTPMPFDRTGIEQHTPRDFGLWGCVYSQSVGFWKCAYASLPFTGFLWRWLFKFHRRRGFGGHIVQHAVDVGYLAHDAAADLYPAAHRADGDQVAVIKSWVCTERRAMA